MARDDIWRIEQHKHSSYEFHFVVSGASLVKTKESTFIVRKGQFYITSPGLNHSQENLQGKNYIEYCLNCSIEELKINSNIEERMMVDILKNLRCMPIEDTEGISILFENALKEAQGQSIGYYSSIKSLVLQIIVRSVRLINNNNKIDYNVPRHVNKNQDRYNIIVNYIKNNINKNITSCDIARHLYLSEKQICRIVKEKKGVSTKQLICKIKLEKAKELLENTEYSIKHISNILGFSSQYYFNQFFKKYESYSPTGFRKSLSL